jgi:hypothetical protein
MQPRRKDASHEWHLNKGMLRGFWRLWPCIGVAVRTGSAGFQPALAVGPRKKMPGIMHKLSNMKLKLRTPFILVVLLVASAAAMLWWKSYSDTILVSGRVEADNELFFVLAVPEDLRHKTMENFLGEVSGEKPNRSFLAFMHKQLNGGKSIKCPVDAGAFSIRLNRGLYVFQIISGKGFEDLRVVNVDKPKELDFSKSIFKLSKTQIY